MGFRRMPFANSSFGVCSGSVKIAQNERTKALVEVQVLQYLLDNQLASTVRIDWRLGVSFIHRYRRGNAVRGARRGEHDLVDSCGLRRSKQGYRTGDIIVIKAGRIADRLANFNSRGKMYDRERLVFPEHLVEFVPIPNIANFERTPFDKFGMTI